MKNQDIVQLVKQAKYDPTVICDLEVRFQPLLQKYARLLEYPDAYGDLQITLFDMVMKLDIGKMNNPTEGAVVKYIQQTLYHRYIVLSRIKNRYRSHHLLYSEDVNMEAVRSELCTSTEEPTEDEPPFIERDFLQRCLTDEEYEIIQLHFFSGYGIREIALAKNRSRQFINSKKLRALEKLKRAYIEYYNC